jgi:hypothetical protein
MTPKEKAKELLDEMSSQTYSFQPYAGAHYLIEEIGWEAGKKCALIAVQQILEIIFSDYDWQYWNEVKKEIEKL